MCQQTNSECVIDETLDLRRKIATKRAINDLEHHKELLVGMVEFLRRADPSKIEQLLVLIRNDASLEEIASVVLDPTFEDTLDAMTESESQDNSTFGGSDLSSQRLQSLGSSSGHGPIPLERLCDVPLFNIKAEPWTNVTDDNQVVSHLVSLYFTWEHPCCQIFDQSLFLQHLIAGKLDVSFCSPFLVNSLLAVASVSGNQYSM
jgi:hypothetical protein